ncbi:TPA: fimbrial protein [Citrobacter koseri]|uniref:Major fimbrial subunit n=1 Tax=Citrobacter koseri TaxID=545 RepID=A0A2X2VDV5_CITKO|nr:fimbrial protein [Citrobacter koseri]EKY0741697.1 fimbrial protein [Citrobacter koseri]MBI0676238.1 fimbrial protein [Citrobacter koseri]MBJ8985886.1 fimbrial protein [Citrobacter koseri]MBJ9008058.1 fimbrial protein [Citrobacter koseri]MBJ9282666.1 fimbrial protein [Citrobacter koseri]
MKRSIIAASVLSAIFMSAGVFAAELETGTLTIEGEVINSSCYFKNGLDDSRIVLPGVDASRFSGLSAGETVGAEEGTQTAMKIVCPVGSGLKTIRITNGVFNASGVLKKSSGGAEGVGFNLKLGNKPITNDQETDISGELTPVSTGDGEEYTLDFKAQYARLDSSTAVIAGDLSSVLTISVSAD